MRKFTFIKSLFLAVALLAGNAVWGQTEDFEAQTALTSSYASSNFTNATTGITWSYTNSRNQDTYGITNKGIMLRYADSYLEATFANGVGTFSFQYRKAYTGTSERQLELIVNGTSVVTGPAFGTTSSAEATIYDFTHEVNTAGPVTIKIKNIGTGTNNKQTVVDNIAWTNFSGTITQVSSPTISATGVQKATDNFYNSATVTLSSTTDGASIYYTTNGDAPTTASTVYTAPFEITATSTIKAIATKTDMDNSAVAEKTITITELVAPTLTVTELTVPAMTAVTGLTDTETVNVSGAALTADILVTIDGADAAMFSVLPASIAQTSGEASGAVTVTYSPTAPGTHTATLKFNSTGATEVTRTLTGTSGMATPVAIDGSGISQTGFTANWNAVAGATEYELNVYTKGGSTPLNLVSNPGFETGTTTSWNFESAMNQEVATDIVKSGTYSLKTSVAATKKITQTITVQSGKEYTLSFWYYLDNASTGNGFRVWTSTGATIQLPSSSTYFNTKGSWEQVQHTFTPTANSMILELRLYSGATLYIDDFSITGEETTTISTPIAGSPFTVTGETSKAITDLTAGTTYYYTVVAKNGSVATAVSNEVAVTTSTGTGLSNTVKNMNLRAVNGNIVLNAEAGQLVEVYNSIGQRVGSRLTSEGVNTITARVKGVVFVKIGSDVSKLIME
ncbi:MAG: chitobiase/beta-hexosaminidase C-terminal domain-containing protein [Paludibacter sp.]|jgi:hypothetical protein|nr:chitobiase/beta-hexosaminidase C-terminal domain-containing protein [Paludibacter sp.]